MKKIIDHGHGPWHCMIKFRVIFGNLSTLTTGTYLYLRNLEVVYGPLQCVMSMQQNACSVVYQQPLEFRRFYVTHTFLHYDVTSSLRKSWENPCYLGETSCKYVHLNVFMNC